MEIESTKEKNQAISIENVDAEVEDQPYEDYDDDESDSIQEESDHQIIEKEIILSAPIIGYGVVINKKAMVLGVKWEIDEKNNRRVFIKGDSRNVGKMTSFFNELDEIVKDPSTMKLLLGETITKELPRTKAFDKFRKEIESFAEGVEVYLQVDFEKIILSGYQRKINELIAFIYEREAEFEQGDFTQQELNISTFHRAYKKQIQETAHLLELKCEFGYDTIKVAGLQRNVDQVIMYLLELESQIKKTLFPKYWDFKQTDSFCVIPISSLSEEFQMVRELFSATMKNQIHSICRIQNKFVMDHYICMLQKRMELNLLEAANRKLLFAKGNNKHPKETYGNFDTGFDIQYGTEGEFGWGLYFSEKASTLSSTAYQCSGRSQMILADVFIGNPFESLPQRYVKPPEGYDCVKGLPPTQKKSKLLTTDLRPYVIYNNFYSYPLYLIEYCN